MDERGHGKSEVAELAGNTTLWFTKYDVSGPSSRQRVYALRPKLMSLGWEVEISPQRPRRMTRQAGATVRGVARRTKRAWEWHSGGPVVVQKELLPAYRITLPACRRLLRSNAYVWDVDDAVWANSEERAQLARLHARRAAVVVTGTEVLARWIRECGQANVQVIPTCTYVPNELPVGDQVERSPVRIGWIGSPQSESYLESIGDVLLELSRVEEFEFCVMGGRLPTRLRNQSWAREYEWSLEKENDFLDSLDIGVAPLSEDTVAAGKCGFKLTQYMARGVSAIGQDNEAHRRLLGEGRYGLLVRDRREWFDALAAILRDGALRRGIGWEGYRHARKELSLEAGARAWDNVFRSLYEEGTVSECPRVGQWGVVPDT